LATLRLDRLTKTYPGGPLAVDGVTLGVADDEMLVLVGPSGCGKTTLLRLVAGLEAVTSGRVLFGERDLTHAAPHARNVALVFQQHTLHPAHTVRDNLAFPLRVAGSARADIDREVRAIAERVGLGDALEARPGQLSGGQQQRAALARALVRRPAAFLFDEPLSNLDAGLRRDLRQLMRQLVRERGAPAVYVTHDQEEALALADRLAVMYDGRVLQVGPPREVYRRPASLRVAAMAGSPAMNFLEGRVEGGAFVGPTDEPVPVAGLAEGRVVLGVRPAALGTGGEVRLTGRVEAVELAGEQVDVTVRLASGQGVTARLPDDAAPREGEAITLVAALSACHWFAAGEEGERLAQSGST
jgi:ABC-type sugar transport system ATPase subunit